MARGTGGSTMFLLGVAGMGLAVAMYFDSREPTEMVIAGPEQEDEEWEHGADESDDESEHGDASDEGPEQGDSENEGPEQGDSENEGEGGPEDAASEKEHEDSDPGHGEEEPREGDPRITFTVDGLLDTDEETDEGPMRLVTIPEEEEEKEVEEDALDEEELGEGNGSSGAPVSRAGACTPTPVVMVSEAQAPEELGERMEFYKEMFKMKREEAPEGGKNDLYKAAFKADKQKRLEEMVRNAPDNSYRGDGSRWSKRLYFIKEAYRRSRQSTPVDPNIWLRTRPKRAR